MKHLKLSTTLLSMMALISLMSLTSCGDKNYDMDQEPPEFKIYIVEQDGMTYTFGNKAKDSYEYYWEFGDEATSRETQPKYTFNFPGDSVTVRCTGFSDGFVTANVDSLLVSCEGGTLTASELIGKYTAKTWMEQEPWEADGEFNITEGERPDEVIIEGIARRYKLWYQQCGYTISNDRGDKAAVRVLEKGVLQMDWQPMFEMDGWDYHAEVWVAGNGKYNSETKAWKMDYALFYKELPEEDPHDKEWTGPEEQILMATKVE